MNLQPHQQRVVEEAEQLDERITKLAAFMDSSSYSCVDGHERTMLGSQLQAMRTYSSFLHARMRHWKQTALQVSTQKGEI